MINPKTTRLGKSIFAIKQFLEIKKMLSSEELINIRIIGETRQGMSAFSRNIKREVDKQ